MATHTRAIRVLAAAVATVMTTTVTLAAVSDPPPAKKAEQAASHAAPQAHAPAKKPEPAEAKPAAEASKAAAHGDTAPPVKKSPKPDRKAIEAEVRQVVSRINTAMAEASEKPAVKPAAKPSGGAHASAGHIAEAAVQGHPPAKKKSRPAPLLVWDDTLQPGNVKLVWDPDVVPRAVPAGARLSWGDEKT